VARDPRALSSVVGPWRPRLPRSGYVYGEDTSVDPPSPVCKTASRRYSRCGYPANASPSFVFNHSNIERSA